MPFTFTTDINSETNEIYATAKIKLLLNKFADENATVAKTAAYGILKRNLAEYIKNSIDAQATQFTITLPCDGEIQDKVKILIHDDGLGFPATMVSNGAVNSYGAVLNGKKKIVSEKRDAKQKGGVGQGLAQGYHVLKSKHYDGDLLIQNLKPLEPRCHGQITLISNLEKYIEADFRVVQRGFDNSDMTSNSHTVLNSTKMFERLAKNQVVIGLDDKPTDKQQLGLESNPDAMSSPAISVVKVKAGDLNDFYSEHENSFSLAPATPTITPPKLERFQANMQRRMSLTFSESPGDSGAGLGSKILSLDDDSPISPITLG